ncbi:GM15207 [Drosophila sechellia]|uniref:GM15207 n=1 Tax=Drosophila sechellia TaxID=7238 RepID=B4IBM1_DROSE|nr:GM15207 [Drosophila sechellia]
MANAVVDEETLEAMVYERSKAWSSKMADFVNLEDGMEIDVAEFDNLFHGEDEDPELDDVAKEAVEDNVPDEAKLEMGHINATSVTELTLILCASEDNEAKAEIEEILNQTVPVVEEHKRKWREAGLDRILDTFDEKQIEHHVGRWMRRHNSVYLEASPPKYHPPHHNSISGESDESMHSIDTARYIQQSRRRNAHMSNKNSNMTTIKMYRKHSHKRDELRAKYAYGDEQEHRHHMQTVLLRRRERERQLAYLASTPMQCVYSSGHHMRRKNLRKRRINSWIFDSASSSEEDTSFGGCDCHYCRRHYALSRSVYQSCPYGRDQREYHRSQMASRTMHTMRRQHTFDMEMDLRPRLPENECSCCNSDRLCSNVIHIANSSTEEWVVENRSNHLTQESPEKTRKQKHHPMDARKISHQSVRSKGHEQKPLSSKATSASKLVLSKEKYMQMFDKQVIEETADVSSEVLAKPKPGGSTTASILRQGDDGASNSEDDLQRALAMSKATYKEEQQKRRKTKREPSNKQPQSPAEKSMPVFNNQSVACNSTALANDTACYRVLPKRRGVKRAAAVSTTEEKTATNSSSSPTSSLEEMGSPTGGDPDCTIVTSTTGCEPPASERQEIAATIKITKRGILLHSPSTPEGANFTLTEQGLGKIIGERWARKYLKYHIGSRSFDSRHSVYYQPTPQLAAALSSPQDAQNLANISGSSASDDDIFDQINRYGTVYSILENNSCDK